MIYSIILMIYSSPQWSRAKAYFKIFACKNIAYFLIPNTLPVSAKPYNTCEICTLYFGTQSRPHCVHFTDLPDSHLWHEISHDKLNGIRETTARSESGQSRLKQRVRAQCLENLFLFDSYTSAPWNSQKIFRH